MHGEKTPLSKWESAFFLNSTNLKGECSMKLHRDLGIRQASTCYMAHRIRGMWGRVEKKFAEPVETDATYVGGLEKYKLANRRLRAGRGAVSKTPVPGVKDRGTNQVRTEVVESTNKATLQDFVPGHTEPTATVYTDEHAAYRGIPRYQEAVAHGAGEYVRETAHTNGLESHWALFKGGLDGVYHHVSVKHLSRYTNELEGRHNSRPLDTEDQMATMAQGAVGKRLRYVDLVA